MHWMDVAACVVLYQGEEQDYNNPNSKRASNATNTNSNTKSLGRILSIDFLDTTTLFWSHQQYADNNNNIRSNKPCIVIQTSLRCIVLQLQMTPFSQCTIWTQTDSNAAQRTALARSAILVAHLDSMDTEATITNTSTTDNSNGSNNNEKVLPSSNILPLTPTLFLVGCSDGSLKCWDTQLNQAVKSIRGLGNADWVVQLIPANKYGTAVTAASAATTLMDASSSVVTVCKKRILTLTKKGSAYLIELEWIPGSDQVEIKPPLARFVGGPVEMNDTIIMEHTLFQYDAHRDWVLWLAPASKSKGNSSSNSGTAAATSSLSVTTLLVWNLKLLEKELMGDVKSLLRPEPMLTMQFPAPDDTILTVLPTLQHTAFHPDTVVCLVATSTGELFLQAASSRSRNIAASPVMNLHLGELIQTSGNLDQTPALQIHKLCSQPLGDENLFMVATSLGLVILEWPNMTAGGDGHFYLSAGLGMYGKSLLSMQNSELTYGSLDVLQMNPFGLMEPKNTITVYERHQPSHLPVDYQRRPFRFTPQFLPSPSGVFVCLFSSGEFQYEILHIPSLMQRVGQQRGSSTSGSTSSKPLVASGIGVASFAWIGDDDTYAILHAEEWMNETCMFMATATQVGIPTEGSGGGSMAPASLKLVGGAAALVSGAKLNLTKAATSTTKAAATGATKVATKTAVSGLKKGAKLATFGVFSKKKKKGGGGDDDVDDDTIAESSMEFPGTPLSLAPSSAGPTTTQTSTKKRSVELRSLVTHDTSADLAIGNLPTATSSSLGNLVLRGGGQNLPTALFGGPVLCVASQSENNDSGQAHFYTRKPDELENHASVYVSSGPTLPFPDLCTWDEDGLLCAVAISNRVFIYLSQVPEFVLLGSVRIDGKSKIETIKFIHGVLYCCTWNSVHCIFLGDLASQVCNVECFTLASASFMGSPQPPLADGEYRSLMPPCLHLPLVKPSVLGYQNGSLLVSSLRGVFAVPLNHPILRIGTLLASGQVDRAAKWLDAVPHYDHEGLAAFLERRGHVRLAIDQLAALSLETLIDVTMRYGMIDYLCELVEENGVKGISAIDFGRGMSTSGMFGPESESNSLIVCVGAYLLAHGKAELVRRVTSELLRTEEGKKDALLLASLLLHVNEPDATRLMSRAVEAAPHSQSEWVMGNFVRDALRQK
jgi:WD40 repeat protein